MKHTETLAWAIQRPNGQFAWSFSTGLPTLWKVESDAEYRKRILGYANYTVVPVRITTDLGTLAEEPR